MINFNDCFIIIIIMNVKYLLYYSEFKIIKINKYYIFIFNIIGCSIIIIINGIVYFIIVSQK